jgi:hypothetical protein
VERIVGLGLEIIRILLVPPSQGHDGDNGRIVLG